MGDILIVDDEKDIRELVSDILEDEGYSTRLAADSDQTFDAINAEAPKLIILDIWLKESKLDGIDILKHVRQNNPDIPIVIISGHGNIEIAVAAIKQGAYDFIEKPFNIDQLMVVISRAMETSRLRLENAALRVKDVASSVMIGKSTAFKSLKQQLDKVTVGNSRVMLTGPSGAGKEVAARYIHSSSERASGAFVCVNSASISADKMEEVLFGVESKERGMEMGLLEQAHGGVLFFDEVADMPLGTQSKILRVLVEQQFTRVGGKDKVRVDMRVISSTNRDLMVEIDAGNFREELFHRLNVVPITVPSLEARRDDIPLIAEHFIEELNKTQGLSKRKLGDKALAHLQTRDWPGNVRQLRNVLERSLILGNGSGDIDATELQIKDANAENEASAIGGNLIGLPLREARELFERDYLVTQINRFGGNISKTAHFVGMERSALHRKLKTLNVVTSSASGARVAKLEQTGTDG
ncbi:sigma-54-dependent Fis family transcriptional regulator [Amylibacter marinus]|uniref:Sigma-54-dependent Fis family transcriptional regulator n=1 Tax=Amylibacter marinus TaxID=1475483 RepID=A0ABQ5VSL9_9RHOB|nr:sigma-54 dependent transcriptional regulator [Amylibacter marinus]GLQ34320.1 sigma-54-dependent Fis family transcriptional regulator [Amylibacter marinus]